MNTMKNTTNDSSPVARRDAKMNDGGEMYVLFEEWTSGMKWVIYNRIQILFLNWKVIFRIWLILGETY